MLITCCIMENMAATMMQRLQLYDRKCHSICVISVADDYLQCSNVSPSIFCFICLPYSFCNIYFCLKMLCISWFIFCRKNYVHFFHCQRLWMPFSTLQRLFLELISNRLMVLLRWFISLTSFYTAFLFVKELI